MCANKRYIYVQMKPRIEDAIAQYLQTSLVMNSVKPLARKRCNNGRMIVSSVPRINMYDLVAKLTTGCREYHRASRMVNTLVYKSSNVYIKIAAYLQCDRFTVQTSRMAQAVQPRSPQCQMCLSLLAVVIYTLVPFRALRVPPPASRQPLQPESTMILM